MIGRDKTRRREPVSVVIVSPYGTELEVTEERAEQLLARDPIRLGDNQVRRYHRPGEEALVAPPVTGALPPRKGDRTNTGSE